jgi:hypothetical protein
LWKAAIEAVESVGKIDALMQDQVRHAKAMIGCCIHGARASEQARPEELSAEETVRETVQSSQLFERVFSKKLENTKKFTFESLWPGFTRRFD